MSFFTIDTLLPLLHVDSASSCWRVSNWCMGTLQKIEWLLYFDTCVGLFLDHCFRCHWYTFGHIFGCVIKSTALRLYMTLVHDVLPHNLLPTVKLITCCDIVLFPSSRDIYHVVNFYIILCQTILLFVYQLFGIVGHHHIGGTTHHTSNCCPGCYWQDHV